MYSYHCEKCGGIIEDLADNEDFDAIYKQIAEDLMNNADYKVNADLHLKTAKKLIEAVNNGFGETQFGDKRNALKQALKRNIYRFSVAKSFNQMLYYRTGMTNEKGEVRSLGNFVKWIADSGEIFNSTYLGAEHENAYYSAIMADKWSRFDDDQILEYTTVGDSHVRPSHQVLDKYTAPKSAIFWKFNYPPNGWGCRCSAVPGKANYNNRLTDAEAGRQLKDENKGTPFYNNVGISQVIFDGKHPYFINSKGKETNLSWEEYGLANIEKMRANEQPTYEPKTKQEYFEWWDKQPKINADDIKLKDCLGDDIVFDSNEGKGKNEYQFFKHHILQKSNEKRFEYATELENLLKEPDEIWFNHKDKDSRIYLKNYERGVLKLIINKNMVAESIYFIEKNDGSLLNKVGDIRKGVLLFRK